MGSMGLLRFNQLLPPFDNAKMRQAVLAVIDQGDYLAALAGDPKDWKRCASYFTCSTPMANDAGAAVLTDKRDFAKARQLITEAGYKGEKIVILDAVDLLTSHDPRGVSRSAALLDHPVGVPSLMPSRPL